MLTIIVDDKQKIAFEFIWKTYQFEEQSKAKLEGDFDYRRE